MCVVRADISMCATFHQLALNFAGQTIVQSPDTVEFFGFLSSAALG